MPRTTIPKPPPLAIVAAAAPPRLFAGTSGWAYPTWKPEFYPAALPQKSFLTHYAAHLTSVEVNYTFRALPTPAMLAGWLAATPPSFRFSFKAPQRITHFSRLKSCAPHLAAFLGSLAPVRESGRLGLLLFQLPPNFAANPQLLADFLAEPALRQTPPRALPIAFEFRHPTWFTPEIRAILSDAGAAVCIAHTGDQPDNLITPEIHTAQTHTAFRLRKNGGYTPAELSALIYRIVPLAHDRDTYVYFKHEDEPTGALNAQSFLEGATTLANQPDAPAHEPTHEPAQP